MLYKIFEQVPKGQRSQAATRINLEEDTISSSVEALYSLAVNKIEKLSYGSLWCQTLEDGELRPSELSSKNVQQIFHVLEEMDNTTIRKKNNAFGNWVSNQIIRDICEYLNYHLLEIYQICFLVKLSRKSIEFEHTSNLEERSKKFENDSLKNRFRTLRTDFNIETPNLDTLISVYRLRNIFAHFDGVMQKKYCDKNGVFHAAWPVNKYYLVSRKTGKRVPYHRVKKPFSGDDYSHVQIDWLSQARKCTYTANEKIEINIKELHDLIFFYFYIFQNLQLGIINFMKSNGVQVREFDTYGGQFSLSFLEAE